MTGIDGALTFRPRPAEGPLPAVLASLEAEFVVEWQVAEVAAAVPPADQAVTPA
ncbi:MAG: hypothetical protein ACR2HM_08865 [Acidimicrobiales bacterium]